MGFLESIFGSKPLESTVSVQRARQLFDSRLREEEQKLCRRCNSHRSAIVVKLNDVRAALADLKSQKPLEERALASSAVKERFVERALAIITEFNAKEFSTLADIERFVSEIEKRVEEIRITPREALHVRFFFEEGSAKLASQMNELVRMVASLRQMTSPLASTRDTIEGLFGEFESAKKGIEDARQRIASLEKDRATALARKITPKPFDPSGMNKLRAELKALESRRGLISQAIDSYFSGADKLLKKWLHAESEKDNKILIEMYLESPHKAVQEDASFRIKGVIKKALSKSSELQVDEKDLLKTEFLLSMLDEISRLRKEDGELAKQIEFVRQMVKSEEFLEAQHKADVDRARAVEKVLAEQMKLEENLRREIESLDERSVEVRLRLETELSKFMGYKIKIYDEVVAIS